MAAIRAEKIIPILVMDAAAFRHLRIDTHAANWIDRLGVLILRVMMMGMIVMRDVTAVSVATTMVMAAATSRFHFAGIRLAGMFMTRMFFGSLVHHLLFHS